MKKIAVPIIILVFINNITHTYQTFTDLFIGPINTIHYGNLWRIVLIGPMNRKERRTSISKERHAHISKRNCGACGICCTVVGVPQLKKSHYERCIHQIVNKCSVYKNRPDGCRNFACQWLLGAMETEDRPDRIKIVFDITDGGDIGKIPVAIETENGSSRHGRALETIKTIIKNSPVLIMSPDGSSRLEGYYLDNENVKDINIIDKSGNQLNAK